jgi:hypothetical protein
MRRDPHYRIGLFDVMAGYALSLQWCVARNLFIKFHCRRTSQRRTETRLRSEPQQNLEVASRNSVASSDSITSHGRKQEDFVAIQ